MFGVSGSDSPAAGEPPVSRKRPGLLRALWRRLFTPDRNWQPTQEKEHDQQVTTEPESRILVYLRPVPLPWHSIETDTGTQYMFCTEECLNSYTIHELADDEHYVSQKFDPKFECFYCYWCGVRMFEPKTCFTHGNHCPVTSWSHTQQAVETYRELRGIFQDGEVPEEVYEDAEAIAEMYGIDLPGRAIAHIAYNGWKFFQ